MTAAAGRKTDALRPRLAVNRLTAHVSQNDPQEPFGFGQTNGCFPRFSSLPALRLNQVRQTINRFERRQHQANAAAPAGLDALIPRRALHAGHTPRPLHEYSIRKSC